MDEQKRPKPTPERKEAAKRDLMKWKYDRLAASNDPYKDFRTFEKVGGAWTMGEALELIKRLRGPLEDIGFGIGLAGSVLYEGRSDDDVDFVIFPITTSRGSYHFMRKTLAGMGMKMRWSRAEVAKFWEEKGSDDHKNVEVWRVEETGKRVDILLLR